MNQSTFAIGSRLDFEEVQARLFELLLQFDTFCSEKEIRYYLASGTLLGAVRHQGFIPWDDDVDVVVPRPDYDRLLQFREISDECALAVHGRDSDYYHPYAYCNVVDRKTHLVEHNARRQTGNGLFIDVFPLDGMPDDFDLGLRRGNEMIRWSRLASYINQQPPKLHSSKMIAKRFIMTLVHLLPSEILLNKVDSLGHRYPFKDDGYCAQWVCSDRIERVLAPVSDWCGTETRLPFNGVMLPVPNGYDHILKICFGDYMQLPPVEDRAGHHGVEAFWVKSEGEGE